MIKHNCLGSPDKRFPARTIYFADPGEPIPSDAPQGSVCYERASTEIGMLCPQCGATVPYELSPVTQAKVIQGGTVEAPDFVVL